MATRLLRPASSALASASPLAKVLPVVSSVFRTMSSSASAAPKAEWLVVVPDKPNTMAKRLEVRPTHFANLVAVKESGALKFGGAYLRDIPSDVNDPTTFDFMGSSVVLQADSKADVIEWLKSDVYYKEGVWDVENAQIYYMKTAIREPLP